MITLARRASLIVVLLLLLASVGTASAECAWVMWLTRDAGGTTQPSVIYASYATIADCVKVLDHEERAARADSANQVARVAPTTLDIGRLTPLRGRSFLCLPDTIDPRGPKSK